MLQLNFDSNNVINGTRKITISLKETLGLEEALECEVYSVRSLHALKRFSELSDSQEDTESVVYKWVYACLVSWNVDAESTYENVRAFFSRNTVLLNGVIEEISNSGKFLTRDSQE